MGIYGTTKSVNSRAHVFKDMSCKNVKYKGYLECSVSGNEMVILCVRTLGKGAWGYIIKGFKNQYWNTMKV